MFSLLFLSSAVIASTTLENIKVANKEFAKQLEKAQKKAKKANDEVQKSAKDFQNKVTAFKKKNFKSLYGITSTSDQKAYANALNKVKKELLGFQEPVKQNITALANIMVQDLQNGLKNTFTNQFKNATEACADEEEKETEECKKLMTFGVTE